jgi:uncharacterized protein
LPDLHPAQWLLGGLCAVLVGMAKTGVPGLGILVVPLMFAVVPEPLSGPGTLLPLLCAADCFGVLYFRRHARAWDLMHLFPWVACGIALGTGVLHLVSDHAVRLVVGGIVLLMVGAHLLRKRLPDQVLVGDRSSPAKMWRKALLFGIITGFATTVANAAGPVMNLYLLTMDLAKDQFMGTGAWFFFLVNLIKVPIYLSRGWIDAQSLALDAWLLPGVLIGALIGKRIYDRIPQRAFEITVLSLTVIAGISLFVR